jgi:hypothetical protein
MVLCTQLCSSLSKSRAYPPGHPVVAAATASLVRLLDAGLGTGQPLTIGVARDRLLIEGRETEPGHGILRELAERFHRHQIAAIQFRPGVEPTELADLLVTLAEDSWRAGTPLGLERQDRLFERWPHVSLEPLPLARLELGEGGAAARGGTPGADVWRGLVAVALREASGGGGEGTSLRAGTEVARAIRQNRDDAAYCRAVVSWLVQMDDQVAPATDTGTAHERVAELVGALDPETLDRLVALGANNEQRRELVARGARVLPIPTVLSLLQSAATSSGQGLSTALLRMLTKLADHADPARGRVIAGAEEVVRNSVRHLVMSWDREVDDAQPHRQLLDLLVQPGEAGPETPGRASPGTVRVAHMGLELGVEAPALSRAVQALRDAGDLETLVDLLERGEAAGRPVAAVWRVLTEPGFLRAQLLDEETNLEALSGLLDRMEDRAAGPLLDALEGSESASRRKWILARLERIMPRLGTQVVERLRGKPWFVVRNLLGLIASMPEPPAGFSAMPYLTHQHPKVRREAFKLLVANPAHRAAAILRAVRDPDSGIVLLALAAAEEDCPAELGTQLLQLLDGTWHDPDLRLPAIRLLGRRPTLASRDWLMAQVARVQGFLFFRRTRLADRSPEMLAALGALAGAFSRDPAVQAVLQLARASQDPDVRAAAGRTP